MALTKRCAISSFCGPFYDGDAFGVPSFGFDKRKEKEAFADHQGRKEGGLVAGNDMIVILLTIASFSRSHLRSSSAGSRRVSLRWNIVMAWNALEVLNPLGGDLPGVLPGKYKSVTKVLQDMNVLLEHISP